MARKKTYGQAPWKRFKGDQGPFASPVYDITSLQRTDGYLTVGNTAAREIQVLSQFAFPLQVDAYKDWAVHNPTMDPRAWLPLAQSGLKPDSAEGQAISNASSTADLAAGVTATPGVAVSGVGSQVTAAPGLAKQPDMFASVPQKVTQEDSKGPLTSFMEGAGGVLGSIGSTIGAGAAPVVDSFQTAARAVQYGLMSGYDAIQATQRTTAGLDERQMGIAEKYGLSEEEANLAFPVGPITQAVAGKDLNTRPSNPDQQPTDNGVLSIMGRGIKNRAMVGGSSSSWENISADRKEVIRQAQEEYNAQPEAQPGAVVSAIVGQTPAGAIAENPDLLLKDKGWLASSEGVYLRNEAASIVAFDMRTLDEVKRGVNPVGWTPGRGIAHYVAAPDEQAFYTMSGIIDFFANAGGDPANAIPLNSLNKIAKGGGRLAAYAAKGLGKDPTVIPGAIERGMKIGGEKVGVQTTQRGMKGAREGASGKAALNATETVARVQDPELLAAKGTKVDAETGLVTTPHGNVVMAQAAWDFLNSGRGTRMIDDLVQTDSPAEVMLRSGRKIDAALARQIADAKDAPTMRAVIGSRLGMDLNDPTALRNFGSQAPALFKNAALRDSAIVQMFRKAPHAKPIDLENTDHAVYQLERFGRGAGMKWDDVKPHLDALIRTDVNDNVGLYKVVYGEGGKGGFFGAVADHLANDVGIEASHADAITRAFKGGLDQEMRNYVNAGVADMSTAGGAAADNVGYAMLESEMFNRLAAIPDYRTVRSVGAGVARITKSNLSVQEKQEAVAKFINGATTAWKSTVLIRPAYVAREVGEMSVAASLAGYSGVFTHPARFVSLMMSTIAQKEAATAAGRVAKAFATGEVDHRSGKIVQGFAKDTQHLRALADFLHLNEGLRTLFPAFDHTMARVNGDEMWAEMNYAMNTGDMRGLPAMYDGMAAVSGNFQIDEGLGRLASRQVDTVAADSTLGTTTAAVAQRKRYVNGLIEDLLQHNRDGDMKALASGTFQRAVADAQFSGRMDKKRRAQGGRYAPLSDEQIMQDHVKVLQQTTGNDPALIEAIATGMFNGEAVSRGNKALREHIEKMLADDTQRAAMKPTVRYDKAESDHTIKAGFDRTMERFFEGTGEISDMMQRGPLIREAYAKEAIRLVPEMTAAAKAEAVRKMREAGDPGLARQIQGAGKANGTLTAEDVDHIASTFARDESRRIFYDAHERQNYALALRAVMPFAQATFNTIRRWGELSLRNPQLMYRTLKPLNYAQQPGSAAIYGAMGDFFGQAGSDLYDPSSYGYDTPDTRHNSVDGFFYNDANGERRFTYPLVGLLASFAQIPEGAMNSSSLSGLNVAGTTIQPGFGPAITLPASFIEPINDALESDGTKGSLARFMFPYGMPEGSIPEKVWGSVAPTWAQKVNNSMDEQDTVANLAVKMAPVLLQQGGYDLSNSAEQTRLWNDASSLASRLYLWNAFMGSITPSTINTKAAIQTDGPGGQFSSANSAQMAEEIFNVDPNDKAGNYRRFVIQDKLKQEWNRYTQGGGGLDAYRDGVLHFVHDYGVTGLFSVLPGTRAGTGDASVQATNDVWHFRSQEPEAYSENQDVIGLFFAGGGGTVPGDQGPTGFSLPLYMGQKQSGDRVQKQKDFITDAMNEYGWMLWNPKSKEIDGSGMDTQGIALAKDQLRQEIRTKTGGAWTGKPKDSGKTDSIIENIKGALTNDAVMSLASAPYIATYMQKRDDIIAQLHAEGRPANLGAKKNQQIVMPLITLAQQLIQQDGTGAFNNAWNRVFIDEFQGG